MKKQISRALLGFATLLLLAVSASAQTTRGIEVQVPFDFVAGRKEMPAGHYTVRRVKYDSETALLIQSEDKRDAAIILTSSGGRTPSGASLTFRQYGARFFLAVVSMPGTASLRAVPKSGGERRTERRLVARAKADGKPGDDAAKTVTVGGTMR
jgi:hypothetical protein